MRRDFLGIYTPGDTVFHRMGVGTKYLVLLLEATPPLFLRDPWVTLGFLLASAVFLLVAAGPRVLVVPWAMFGMLAVLGAYQGFLGAWGTAFVVVGNVVIALYASRLVMSTTPGSVLLDALVGFVRPLRHIGLDPEKFALAVGLMIRSIPYLIGCITDVGDALRARGGRRNPALFLTPVVIRGVKFAQMTGEALAARGLGESTAER